MEQKIKHAQNTHELQVLSSTEHHEEAHGRHQGTFRNREMWVCSRNTLPSCRQMTLMSKKHKENDGRVSERRDCFYWDRAKKGSAEQMVLA